MDMMTVHDWVKLRVAELHRFEEAVIRASDSFPRQSDSEAWNEEFLQYLFEHQ